MIGEKEIKKLAPRLRRVEGQVKGLLRMVENKKYCIDLLQQVAAIRGALKSIGLIILENHINTCVKETMRSKNNTDIKDKISELVEIYEKFSR